MVALFKLRDPVDDFACIDGDQTHNLSCGLEGMNSAEGAHLAKKDMIKSGRILPESPKGVTQTPVGRDETYYAMGNPSSSFAQSPGREIFIDDKWKIDPKLLFVGPRIGEGGYGKVYEGKYHNQTVALKLLQPGSTPEEVAKRENRFAREVSLLCRIQHRNLVKFIGACKEPSVMVVVTELLQGGSLRKLLMGMRPKRLDQHLAVKFALDITEAMDCLHQNGIIHRDLKPDNLLLTADQKTLKLVDFGLAREETLTEMMTAETGTYRWMAPELYSTVTLRNGEKKHYNHKVDVYSFSIVLWEILTNRMPFEGMSNLQAAYAAAFKGMRPALSDDLNLPTELVSIMQACWAEDPNSRPNFSEVAQMLKEFLSTLPLNEHMAPQQQMVSKIVISSVVDKPKNEAGSSNPDLPKRLRGGLFGCCMR